MKKFNKILVFSKTYEASRLRESIAEALPKVQKLADEMKKLNLPLKSSDLIPLASDPKTWIENSLPIPSEALISHGLRLKRSAFVANLDLGNFFPLAEALRKLNASLAYFEVDEDYKVHFES